MRRLRVLPFALAGLALALPSAADAGLDSVCSTCGGQPQAPAHKHKTKKARHLCAACAAKAEGTIPADVPVVATAGCSACAASAAGTSGPVMASAPGFASVGDGSSSPIVLASPSSPPGYAVVGGTVVSAEPAPIGVMRTNYSVGPQQMPGTLGASVAASPASAPGMTNAPYARPDELPPSIYSPQRPRRSVLARIFLPDIGRRRAAAEEALVRERHAQISYSSTQGGPSELPPTMVYGGR